MARTDAVQFFLELAAEWRRLGAEVTFEPGWERRGNGMSPAYEGGSVHHTASFSSVSNPFPTRNMLITGRTGLSGPLCNVAGPVCPVASPRLHIMAAFPANHAGASGGRSMGPLPTTSLFNRIMVGLEIDYAGVSPMIGGQYRAALIFTAGLANVLGRSVEWVRAHAETSITGKWDPGYAEGRTYDMAQFRRDAATLAPLEEDMPLNDDDLRKIRSVVEQVTGLRRNELAQHITGQTDLLLKGMNNVDEAALAASLAPLLAPRVSSLSAEDLALIADAVADEQARRQQG